MLSDLRIAFRALARKPLYSYLAILTLGLGIAASTVMYTVVDGILLRPLPFPESDRIVNVHPTTLVGDAGNGASYQRMSFSYPELEDIWRDAGDVFDGFGMAYVGTATLRPAGGEPERIPVGFTTATVLSQVLRIQPLLGRSFTRDDEIARASLVMLSESFWRDRFAADPAVIGRPIQLGSLTLTIVGVLPGDPTLGGQRPRLWYLMQPWTNRGDHRTYAIGRLGSGATAGRAEDRVRTILEPSHPHGVEIVPRKADLVARVRGPLWILGAASFLLLLIAATNVSALHLGRMIDRQGEIAVRRALGAGGRQLALQLASEGLILSAGSALVGILLARYGFSAMSVMIPVGLPRVAELALDLRVMSVGVGVALVTGILTSLIPLLALRGAVAPSLIGSTRGSVRGRAHLQGAVIVAQIALATVLLYGTGLLTRTVNALSSTNPGFAVHELTTFALSYPPTPEQSPPPADAAPRDRATEVMEMIRALPGVRGVAVSDITPLGPGRGNNEVTPEGYVGDPLVAERRFVSGDYFEVTSIPLVEGRGISPADDRLDGPNHIVISRGLAQRAWPGQSALGKHISFWGRDPYTVIGVADDLRDLEMRSATPFAFYVARQQMGQTGGNIFVRTNDPVAMTATIRRVLSERMPGVAFIDAGPMTRHIETAIASERFRARLTLAFAVSAALFCMFGVYGVVARTVASREKEFGIRMAVGADSTRIMRGVVGHALQLAAIGGGLGILFAFWGAQFLRSQLWGVSQIDVVTLVGVAVLLVAIATLSALGPSWRASRIEPTVALRSE